MTYSNDLIELLSLANWIATANTSHAAAHLEVLKNNITNTSVQACLEETVEHMRFGSKEAHINHITTVYNRVSSKQAIATLKDKFDNITEGSLKYNEMREEYLPFVRSYIQHFWTNTWLQEIFKFHTEHADRIKGEAGFCHMEAIVVAILKGVEDYADYCLRNEVTELRTKTIKHAILF